MNDIAVERLRFSKNKSQHAGWITDETVKIDYTPFDDIDKLCNFYLKRPNHIVSLVRAQTTELACLSFADYNKVSNESASDNGHSNEFPAVIISFVIFIY